MNLFLLNNGFKINDLDNEKRTLLHLCALDGYTKKVLFLIENGANKKLKDINGKTAYDLALEQQYFITANEIMK